MSDTPAVLAFDHGTSGIKAALATRRGEIVDFAYVATATSFLPGGGAEQDPAEWWQAMIAATAALL
ncbi:MAG TPA: FGGY family carbohydrate kinase, partial [Terriglobales bacterium]|nr:FGGY family carbohydrate kinase [Terriglobales bacterium]